MKALRPYVPLLGFVLPTAVIGYGVVIPRSCIAGVNALTVGFGTTLLGAAVTYVAGLRLARPRAACTRPPLTIRLSRALNRQAARPSGWLGCVLGLVWPREHRRLNAEALDALDLRPGQRVLEIGPGPGATLQEAARRARGGRIVGLDVSALMVRLARRRNGAAVARGEVEVRQVEGTAFGLDGATFDRILSVHCVYFWRDVDAALAQLARALAPGGRLLLAFRPEGDDVPVRFRDPTYRFPRPGALEAALQARGLRQVRTVRSRAAPGVVLLTAERAGDG